MVENESFCMESKVMRDSTPAISTSYYGIVIVLQK